MNLLISRVRLALLSLLALSFLSSPFVSGAAVPVVGIRAEPARTSEPIPFALVLPGRFIAFRTGDREAPLEVYLGYSGTASRADVESLPEVVVIPAGQESIDFRVLAKTDNLVEGTETLTASIRPVLGLPDQPPVYEIDAGHAHATIEIADFPQSGGEPVVSVIADPAHTSEPAPNIRIVPGAFVFKRTGSLESELRIFVEISGTATPDRDYALLHQSLVFGKDESTVRWQVVPFDDESNEPDETVVARVVESPLVGPLPSYRIDPARAEARVIIHDSDRTNEASLTILEPQHGESFERGEAIKITAVAVDPNGYIPHVEFFAGDTLIGVSQIDFITPPPNGTPITHEVEWSGAAAGSHTIVARATLASGEMIRSPSVTIRVGEGEPSQAHIEITRPAPGQSFPDGRPIEVHAVAIDPEGYIPRLEFFANERLIGVSEIFFFRAPDPGTPIHHEFTWTNPPAGDYKLTARGVDSKGQIVSSPAIPVTVTPSNGPAQVVLAISAVDPIATEGSDDSALFRITRVGGPLNVRVFPLIKISGTARNGIDYNEIPVRGFDIPAGRESVDIAINPVPDKALEGEETVFIELIPTVCPAIFPPPPECYLIAPDRGSARVVIRDSGDPHGNLPPKVEVASPRRGAVFAPGQDIELLARAEDPDGTIHLLELQVDGQILTRAERAELAAVWTNPPAGTHIIQARAKDNLGAESISEPVQILVRVPEGFATRVLPDGFSPGSAFAVTVRSVPPAGTSAWAVEDTPPREWTVSEISHEGIFDPATGKVKFGPFLDSEDRALTYRLTPPATATRGSFAGLASANGQQSRVGGDQFIESASRLHPADENDDSQIVLNEVTAYAAAWKNPVSLQPSVPVSYVTRAGFLWRNGETYHYDPNAGAAPFCWVPIGLNGDILAFAVNSAARVVSGLNVEIEVRPGASTSAFALEEKLPHGWSAAEISHEGALDPSSNTIRWGVFLDGEARTLAYRLVSPSAISRLELRGLVSADGHNFAIAGHTLINESGQIADLRLPTFERTAEGGLRLRLAGESGQICRLEISTDLIHWEAAAELFLPDGQLDFETEATTHRAFYRLRAE